MFFKTLEKIKTKQKRTHFSLIDRYPHKIPTHKIVGYKISEKYNLSNSHKKTQYENINYETPTDETHFFLIRKNNQKKPLRSVRIG